jgi:hypothetical protein
MFSWLGTNRYLDLEPPDFEKTKCIRQHKEKRDKFTYFFFSSMEFISFTNKKIILQQCIWKITSIKLMINNKKKIINWKWKQELNLICCFFNILLVMLLRHICLNWWVNDVAFIWKILDVVARFIAEDIWKWFLKSESNALS